MQQLVPRLDVKEKFFQGTLAIGGIAGIVEGSMRDGFTLHTAFPGMMMTILAAFLGGFTGLFLKDLSRTLRGMKPYKGVNNEGWIMGGFMGTLLGTLFQVMISVDGSNLVIGSIIGAYAGATCGAFPDEFVNPILVRMADRDADRGADGAALKRPHLY